MVSYTLYKHYIITPPHGGAAKELNIRHSQSHMNGHVMVSLIFTMMS